jgi:hypothetical protein
MSRFNRRDFLKSFGVGLAGLAIPKSFSAGQRFNIPRLGRVASESLSIYAEPSDKSGIRFQRFRDEILHIYQDVVSEDGPGYNPIWHRVWGGYVHSAFVQPVENRLNPILKEFPSVGRLMEVSVPFTQSYRIRQNGKWEAFYRLYFSSTHFAFDTVAGPDGEPFYRVNNALLNLSYYVRAVDMRVVDPSELTPIHPEISPRDKRIEISIDFQSLRAFEYDQLIKDMYVSTGRPMRLTDPDLLPTDTPKGNHVIRIKRPSVHMGDGTLRSDAEAYELPGVPWVSYFAVEGYAIHGTYWHNNFGVTMSHGCINMRSEDAKWVYRWCSPYPLEENENSAYRTKVWVF